MAGVLRLRALSSAILAAAVLVTFLPSAPSVAAAGPRTRLSPAAEIVALARSKVGDAYVYGAEGPYAFDCSGLVIWVYRAAGMGSRIDNGRARSAYALYHWGLSHGIASRSNPQPGDVVVWGGGSHVGIYVGGGMAVSALNPRQGVQLHGVRAVTAPFTAYLHTHLSGVRTARAAAPLATGRTGSRLTRVTTAWLNLRSGPSTKQHVLTVLAPQTALRVLGSRVVGATKWLRVMVGSRAGWVSARYTALR